MVVLILENILDTFHGEEDKAANTSEWRAYFNELCQKAIRIGMGLKNSYYTP